MASAQDFLFALCCCGKKRPVDTGMGIVIYWSGWLKITGERRGLRATLPPKVKKLSGKRTVFGQHSGKCEQGGIAVYETPPMKQSAPTENLSGKKTEHYLLFIII